MATAREIVQWACEDVKAYATGETVDAADAAYCLQKLNDMLFEWSIDGIDIAHTTLALGDTLDVPNSHIGAIRSNLAIRIDEKFGGVLTPNDHNLAENGRKALVAYHFTIRDLTDENPLARDNLANYD